MEALIAPVEYLLWVFTPAGAVVASVLFALLISGLAGRVIPSVEASSSAHRPAGAGREHERIGR